MLRKISLFFVLLVCASTMFADIVSAHGPTRQKVSEKIIIDAPVEDVWNVVKNFHDMSWHPAVMETNGEGGNEPGATRTLILGENAEVHEVLEKYSEEEKKYFYRITEVDVKVLPVSNYSSWLIVRETEDGGAEVEWKGAFYRGFPNNDPPPELSDKAAVDAMTAVYEGGLENLKKLCESN